MVVGRIGALRLARRGVLGSVVRPERSMVGRIGGQGMGVRTLVTRGSSEVRRGSSAVSMRYFSGNSQNAAGTEAAEKKEAAEGEEQKESVREGENEVDEVTDQSDEEQKEARRAAVGEEVVKDLTDVAKLYLEIKERDEKIEALLEEKLRVLADMENTRMIAKRDVANAHQYGISKFAKALLEVADNLGRALDYIPKDKLESGGDYLKELYVGVEMTKKELNKAFQAHDIVEFADEGDKFDPNKHQAMFEAVVPGKEEGVIISVTKKGYMINDRVLRAAEVGVAKQAPDAN